MLAALFLTAVQQECAVAPTQWTREARVLDLLRVVERESGFHYWTTPAHFGRGTSTAAPGQSYPAPSYPDAICGRAPTNLLDDTRAREVAAELFDVFDLDAEPVCMRSSSMGAELDRVALTEKVAFELRGRAGSDPGCPVREAADAALDGSELAELVAQGWRIHAVDLEDFPRLSGDAFTPMAAFVAGVVEFLNATTPGEDVDLRGVCFEQKLTVAPLGDDVAPSYSGVGGTEWTLVSNGKPVHLRIEAANARPSPIAASFAVPAAVATERLGRTSARGAPAMLLWSPVFRAETEVPQTGLAVQRFGLRSITVRQTRDDGSELALTGNTFGVILPSEFDVLRPLDIELDLAPGSFVFDEPLRIGFALPRS